jgi:LCP family protein required for cell wall assembly
LRNTDGFIRRSRDSAGTSKINSPQKQAVTIASSINANGTTTNQRQPIDSLPTQSNRVNRDELNESLNNIDNDTEQLNQYKKHRKERRPETKLRRFAKRSALILGLVILGTGGWVAYKTYAAGSSIFKGNVFAAIASPEKPLKADSQGNTNILLLGTSESDPHHPGAQLTDSMMLVSINQKTKKVFLLSIPRDLWVTYDKPCSAGYSGKINAVYECTLGSNLGGLSSTQTDEVTAETATSSKVGEVLGTDVQYVVHMNLAVVQQVVDAVGGVDISVDSQDPRGILDRNFDWRCKYKCYLVKYPNGPAHLSGTGAMWLAQARNDAGGYGLPRGNFDREANQRKIAIATKDKATSVGFLANPINVVNLLNAIGNNIHTNIDSTEIKSFINLVKIIPSNNIVSVDIQANRQDILTTGTGPDGSSIVEPVTGLKDFSSLQAFMQQLLAGIAAVISEQAPVDVLNGSDIAGTAQTKAAELKSSGILIGTVGSAPKSAYDHYTIYDLSQGRKPSTLAALKSNLGVTNSSTTLPAGINSTASFVVVIGQSTTNIKN